MNDRNERKNVHYSFANDTGNLPIESIYHVRTNDLKKKKNTQWNMVIVKRRSCFARKSPFEKYYPGIYFDNFVLPFCFSLTLQENRENSILTRQFFEGVPAVNYSFRCYQKHSWRNFQRYATFTFMHDLISLSSIFRQDNGPGSTTFLAHRSISPLISISMLRNELYQFNGFYYLIMYQ